jgi:hypothetical protein
MGGHVGTFIKNRLEAKKRIEGECWLWTGACFKSGYGMIRYNKKNLKVHRVSYCLYHNISLDNLKDSVLHTVNCPNKKCFNPEHLYSGNAKQNAADALVTGHNTNANKTHCPLGHEYTTENTRIHHGSRECKTCEVLRSRQFYKKSKRPLGISDIEAQVLDID